MRALSEYDWGERENASVQFKESEKKNEQEEQEVGRKGAIILKYRRLTQFEKEVDTDSLALACLTYPGSEDCVEWYTELCERLRQHPG